MSGTSGDFTGLHLACVDGDKESVQFLISQGKAFNVKDRWGNEPLKYAVLAGHRDIVQMLRSHGAFFSRQSMTDLEYAYCRSAA